MDVVGTGNGCPGTPASSLPSRHQLSLGCSRLHCGSESCSPAGSPCCSPWGHESTPFFENKSSWVAREMQGLPPALPGALHGAVAGVRKRWAHSSSPVLRRAGLRGAASPHVILVEWGSLWIRAQQRLCTHTWV